MGRNWTLTINQSSSVAKSTGSLKGCPTFDSRKYRVYASVVLPITDVCYLLSYIRSVAEFQRIPGQVYNPARLSPSTFAPLDVYGNGKATFVTFQDREGRPGPVPALLAMPMWVESCDVLLGKAKGNGERFKCRCQFLVVLLVIYLTRICAVHTDAEGTLFGLDFQRAMHVLALALGIPLNQLLMYPIWNSLLQFTTRPCEYITARLLQYCMLSVVTSLHWGKWFKGVRFAIETYLRAWG